MTENGCLFPAFLIALFLLPSGESDQSFFINEHQACQSKYIKMTSTNYQKMSIIIFNIDLFNSKLFIFITETSGNKFFYDENRDLGLNGIAIAKSNTKYSKFPPTQSTCQILNPDEILVLGEHSDSYDSRYFGPIKPNHVIAPVKLI